MPGQHGTSLKDYTEALTTQLRLRRVPGMDIGQIVAEVESHVRESGEDPVEAFGQPGSYSAQFAAGRRPGCRGRFSTLRAGAATTMAVAGALMLLEGVFNRTGVVRVTAGMLLAWVAVGLMFAIVVRRMDVVMADRQTRTVPAGRRVPGSRAAYWVHFLALWAILALGSAIRSREGPLLLSVAGWVLGLSGLALAAASLLARGSRPGRIVDPRDRRATPTLAVYLDNLTVQLRLREVPGERIGQILAEVETHASDTGQDPLDAFGEPGEYAASYVGAACATAAPRGWLRRSSLKVAVPCALAVWAVLEGGLRLTGSVDLTARSLGVWLAVGVVFSAVFHALTAQLARDTAGSAKPRRSALLFMGLGWLAYLGGVAILVLIPLVVPTGPTLVSVPGWTLFVAGLLVLFALVRHFGGDRVVDPRR